jgi:squalene cyclase
MFRKNPTEKLSFQLENLMVYHKIASYPECTSSVLQALVLFKELYPGYRTKDIEKSIRNAATFIESRQEENGSWFVLMHHFIICLRLIFSIHFDN